MNMYYFVAINYKKYLVLCFWRATWYDVLKVLENILLNVIILVLEIYLKETIRSAKVYV